MAANTGSTTSRDNSPHSAFIIRPHPLFFYAPPPVMVASPFGIYYTFPTYTYYTAAAQPLPLYTIPRPAPPTNQLATAHTQAQPAMNQRQAANPMEGGGAAGSWTTIIIMNIPNNLGRDFVLEFLDGYCKLESLEYDFFYLPLYLPVHPMMGSNKGFAFVNFTTNDSARRMMQILNGYKWEDKVCKVEWASCQGREAQIRRFQNSNFQYDAEEFSAVIFNPPRNGSHPVPTPPLALSGVLPHPH